jgi:hypothetical protein
MYLLQINFYFGREAFQMEIFPQVSPPKPICTTLVLRTCCLIQPTFSSLFVQQKNILSSADQENAHRSKSTSPPLPHFSHGQI